MKDDNSLTLHTYNNNVQLYLNTTRSEVVGDNKEWLDRIIALLPSRASVLELGSANGRDASYLEQQGYIVLCSDAADAFVEHLLQTGHKTQHINILTDELNGSYDMILANMVLLHFDEDEIIIALAKIKNALRPTGIFACSVRSGQGSEWSSDKLNAPRYYHYYSQKEISDLLTRNGFEITDIRDGDSTNPDKIYIICKPTD